MDISNIPENIEDSKINTCHMYKIYELLKTKDTNIILHGSKGCGKKTILQCIFDTMFPYNKISKCDVKKCEDIKNEYIYFKTTNDYFEIFCDSLKNTAKSHIISILKNVCSNFALSNDCDLNKRYIIIHDIDKLNSNIQFSLRTIFEKSFNTSIFIITTSNYNSVLDALKSRMLCYRIPFPKKDLLLLMESMEITKNKTHSILKQYNTVHDVLFYHDKSLPKKMNYVNILKFLSNKETFMKMKDSLHELLSYNICTIKIMKHIIQNLPKGLNRFQYIEIITLANETDVMINNSSKHAICMEYFVVKLKNIINK